jgi:hypothetical protein
MHVRILLLAALLNLGLSATSKAQDLSGGGVTTTVANTGYLNLLDYGADRTGIADTSSAMQSAITAACGATPTKTIHIPKGTYNFVAGYTVTCSNVGLLGEPGTIFIKDPTNPTTAIMTLTGPLSYFTCKNITFDGNVANLNNAAPAVSMLAPLDHLLFDGCNIQNTSDSGVNIQGEPPLNIGVGAVGVNGNQATGQADLVFTAPVAGVVPGSFPVSNALIDPDMWVTGISGSTITMNRNLPDTVVSGTKLQFSRGFASNADVNYGATVIPTASTVNLSVGETIYTPAGSGACLQQDTKITTVTVNVSVTVDRPVLCLIPSGSLFGAAAGIAQLTWENSVFFNIGQPHLYGSGPTSPNNCAVAATDPNHCYTTVGSSSGSTMTLACISAGCNPKGGLQPGQRTWSSLLPTGVPASDPITAVAYNMGAGQFTITLQNPLIGTIADSTIVPFGVALAGGFATWNAQGAFFANTNRLWANNRFIHSFSTPMFIHNLSNSTLVNNIYQEDGQEFSSPTIAPSACEGPTASINLGIINSICTGATGRGLESDHAVRMRVIGGSYSRNGTAGVSICGGHDNLVSGVTMMDNGQWTNQAYAQTPASVAGMFVGGGCSFGQPGDQANLNIVGVVASDDQATPTQNYGIQLSNSNSTLSGLQIGNTTGSGNTVALIDANLGAGLPKYQQLFSYGSTTGIGNSADTNEDIMCTYTVPANTIANAGDHVHILASGTFASSTDVRSVRIRWNGIGGAVTALLQTNNSPNMVYWTLNTTIAVGDASHQGSTTGGTFGGLVSTDNPNSNPGSQSLYFASTAAVSHEIDITGQDSSAATANAIVCKNLIVEVFRN